jgi:hypothetical protein
MESEQEPASGKPRVPHWTHELIAKGYACDGDRQDAETGGPEEAPPADAKNAGCVVDEIERDHGHETREQQRARIAASM